MNITLSLAGLSLLLMGAGFTCSSVKKSPVNEELFQSSALTPEQSFTSGAEGPAVDRAGTLYAVNLGQQGTIGEISPAGAYKVFLQLPNGSIGNGIRFDGAGNMLIADYTNHNVLQVNLKDKQIRVHAHEPRMSQPNDLAIDSRGRIYASDPNWKKSTGSIWRVDPDGTVSLLEDSMGTTNGIEVSPDEKRLYVNESVQRKVWVYDLSENGSVSNKRLLTQFPDFGMDGMRCDVDGNLYITRHGKGTVVKVSPDGTLLKEITMLGKNPSNIAFGGKDGRTAYVTIQDKGNLEQFRVDRPGREWQMMHRR